MVYSGKGLEKMFGPDQGTHLHGMPGLGKTVLPTACWYMPKLELRVMSGWAKPQSTRVGTGVESCQAQT